jgi:hypothetical protein
MVAAAPVLRGQTVRDIGHHRQLFVDDYLIDSVQGMSRTMHPAVKHAANPLIVPELPFERRYKYHYTWDNGSVIYDARRRLFRAYFSSVQKNTLYAESDDGVSWRKPALGKVSYGGTTANNILLEDVFCTTVMFDAEEENGLPYRMYALKRGVGPFLLRSRDGIEWEGQRAGFAAAPRGDSGACVYDPYTRRYVAIFKARYPIGKMVTHPLTNQPWDVPVRVLGMMTSGRDFTSWTPWREVLRPDEEDHQAVVKRYPGIFVEGLLYPWRMRPEFEAAHELEASTHFLDRLTVPPQQGFQHMEFMNMVVIPYHGLYLGLLQVLHTTAQVIDFGARGAPRPDSPGQDGTMEVQLVSSRDLIHWERVGSRAPFLALGDVTAWDRSMLMPFTSNGIHRDGKTWLYYGGSHHSHRPNSMWNKPGDYPEEMQGLGLATIREDGFVSMDAAGAAPGSLTTLPLRFNGTRLVVNADAAGGLVAVELLDVAGRPIPGYTQGECVALTADSVRQEVRWRAREDLAALRGGPLRMRLVVHRAKVYSIAVT